MKIILTASFENGIFCNGLQQNIVFLAQLLNDLGHESIICLPHDIDRCIDAPKDILLIERKEIINHSKNVDLILNTAWMIEEKVIKAIKKVNSSFRNIHILYGNSLLADVERCSWNDHIAVCNKNVDEVWISPHYKFSFEYFKTYYKTDKVKTLPYIWSPYFVDLHEGIWNKADKTCFYSPGKDMSIGILEPNLNITKHCLPSIMSVECLHNNFPEVNFKKVVAYCSKKLMDKKYFKSLMWNLNITKNLKIEFAGRKMVSGIFSHECNLFLSHQLLNALNYTYMEALYFNMPLIHNSEIIRDAGYFYADYNVIEAAKMIKKASEVHDSNLDSYRQKSQSILNKYSPNNPEVINEYRKLLS